MPHHPAFRPERLLALDIETVPDRERLPPDWGTKFPKCMFHRIACISFVEARIAYEADGSERYAVTACRSGGEADWDERRLLEQFWRFFAQHPTRVVGWNTRGFDLPVLLQRSLLHGLSAAPWFRAGSRHEGYTYRYADRWHADLMDQLADYGACTKLGLDEAARACGLPGKGGGHGSEVEGMVAAGEVEAVRRYCEGDTLNLYGLYLRHGLLTGRTSRSGYDAAIASLAAYLDREGCGRLHLGAFLSAWREAGGLHEGERADAACAGNQCSPALLASCSCAMYTHT